MAKSKSSRGRSADTNVDAIALTAMLRPPVPRPVVTPQLPTTDERLYTPLRLLVPLGPSHQPARLSTPQTGSFRRGPIRFQSAALVDICRKRHQRREVIFAKRKSGKGAKARYRVRKEFSGISCK